MKYQHLPDKMNSRLTGRLLAALLLTGISGLQAQIIYDTDTNDSHESASAVPLNHDISGTLGYPIGGGPIDAVDWYVFEIPTAGFANIELTTSGTREEGLGLWNGVKVYADQMIPEDFNYVFSRRHHFPGTSETYRVIALQAGRYFLELKASRAIGEEIGSYQLRLSFEPPIRPVDPEPNDDLASAVTVPLDTEFTGNLGFRGAAEAIDREDWYTFTLPRDGTIDLSLSTSGTGTDAESDGSLVLLAYDNNDVFNPGGVHILDADQTTEMYRYFQESGQSVVHTVPKLKAGNYYLRLRQEQRGNDHSIPERTGTYAATLAFTPEAGLGDPEPNDTIETAAPLALGSWVNGHLGYKGGGMGLERDLYDWFRFSHPGGNVNISLSCGEDVGLHGITLYTGNGDYIWYNRPARGQDHTFTIENQPAGEYCLSLRLFDYDWEWGPYDLQVGQGGNPVLALFPDAEVSGPWYNCWLGWFFVQPLPHLHHLNHGWLYILGPDENTLYYYDYTLGYLFTSRGLYPYIYQFSRQGWIYYQMGSSRPARWFLDLSDSDPAQWTWFSVD